MARFKINFDLTRSNDLRDDDESWFDKEHISSEIKSWLEDLDYRVKNLTIVREDDEWTHLLYDFDCSSHDRARFWDSYLPTIVRGYSLFL